MLPRPIMIRRGLRWPVPSVLGKEGQPGQWKARYQSREVRRWGRARGGSSTQRPATNTRHRTTVIPLGPVSVEEEQEWWRKRRSRRRAGGDVLPCCVSRVPILLPSARSRYRISASDHARGVEAPAHRGPGCQTAGSVKIKRLRLGEELEMPYSLRVRTVRGCS
jgi:hypothetical protein